MWRWIGFGVPTVVAFGFAVDAVLDTRMLTYRSGYEGLGFLFGGVMGVALTLAWLAVGALVARFAGPPRAASSFAAGAALALAAVLIIFTASCFLAIA